MATSSLTEFKLGKKTLFSIYTKRGGQPDDISVSVLKMLNKIKRRKNGLEQLLKNFEKTKNTSGINEVYDQLNIQFDNYGFIEHCSLPVWNAFVEKHPECRSKTADVETILNKIIKSPENVLNIKREFDPKQGFVDCHNVVDFQNNTLKIRFYDLNKTFDTEGLTVEKLRKEICA